jgi:hypothetical protein
MGGISIFMRNSFSTAHFAKQQAIAAIGRNKLSKSHMSQVRHGCQNQALVNGFFPDGKRLIEKIGKRFMRGNHLILTTDKTRIKKISAIRVISGQ